MSRLDSLERPRGAGRVPLLALASVGGLVMVVLVAGLARVNVALLLILPALLLTAYICVNVVRTMLVLRRAEQEAEASGDEP
ncbi:MAG: hypothetical protein ACPGQL_10275 [Thermoplasmatota archaeon]